MPPLLLLLFCCLLSASFSAGRDQSSSSTRAPKCRSPLGVSSGGVKDDQMTASSSFSPASVGAENGRLGTERGGGAWCPANLISRDNSGEEWLQVDLGTDTMVTGVITQGRYAGGQGVEFAEEISVWVWREAGQEWEEVVGGAAANRDTYSKVEVLLGRAELTSRVRVAPVSSHPRMVCLRVELLGCSPDDLTSPSTTEVSKVEDIEDNVKVIKDIVIQDADTKDRESIADTPSSDTKVEPQLIQTAVSEAASSVARGEGEERVGVGEPQHELVMLSNVTSQGQDTGANTGIVTVSSSDWSEGNYMLVSVVVLVSIIVILIVTIIFILYKNYQFTHSKHTPDTDTLESSYPLYSARTLDSHHHHPQVYSNSVQTTPYKHSSTNNNPATNSSNYNTSNTTSFNTMYSYPQQYHHHHQHHQQQQQSNPSSQYSNYYATTDLIQWHNRKYLSGSHNPGSGGPVDL